MDNTALVDELGALPALQGFTRPDRAALASLCSERPLPAGMRLLEQGGVNTSLFFLRRGQVAVSIRRGERHEVVAIVSAPAILGEVSFLSGRPCSASIDVLVDAGVAELPGASLRREPLLHARMVQALAPVLADRLYAANTGARRRALSPVVLLRQGIRWAAPRAFPVCLATALADDGGGPALLVVWGSDAALTPPSPQAPNVWTAGAGSSRDPQEVRAVVAAALPGWTDRFRAIVIQDPRTVPESSTALGPLATHVGHAAGPGDPLPEPGLGRGFVVQDAASPTLAHQSVTRRLLLEAAAAEQALAQGRPLPDTFLRGVASLARAVRGTTFGWVLGAGGARGWAHIGVLEVLTRAGLPIDAVSGSSMGAIVGGLVAQGTSIDDLRGVMAEWPRRLPRLRERRFWRMHLASERGIEALLTSFFGDRGVPALALPYAANAVDIERGEEVVITTGLLRQATRASMAFPGWLPPFTLEGRPLVDGATLNPVPVAACQSLGADLTLAVNVLGPPAPQALPRHWPLREFEVMSRTFQLCGYSMGQSHGEASDVTITPELGDATMNSFDRFDEMIARGRAAAEARLAAVMAAYRASRV